MLSRDSAGLKQNSPTANRWRLLRDQGTELDVVVMSRDAGSWSEEGLRVWSGGGSNVFQRYFRSRKKADSWALVCDLITAQDPFELGWIAKCVSRKYAKPFELQDHGGFFDGGEVVEPLWPLRSRVAGWLSRRASRIRTVSPMSHAKLTESRLGEKTYLLPIAADARFAKAKRRPEKDLVVTTGRLVAVKRHDLLIRAFALYAADKPGAKLAIVGEGPERKSLKKLIKELKLEKKVEFVGDADPLPWLERASVFALLSKHEGWGVAAIEAAMVGVPVVMSDTGCADWLSQAGRALVTKDDPKEIAKNFEAAKALSTDTPLPSVMSQGEMAMEQVSEWNKTIKAKQRTLICAQAADENDPLFGFFVPWLRKFAEHGDAIVCALRVSDPLPELPSNIEVRATRPKDSKSKIGVIWNVARISWQERFRYQSVFIRGDAQYLACLGWLWRLLGKKVVFWYTHYTVKGPWFWLAAPWANDVVTAVPESNPLKTALSIGHHLDIEKFKPRAADKELEAIPRVLLFGRVSPVKRVAWMVQTLAPLVEAGKIRLTIVGKATDAASSEELKDALPQAAKWDDRDVPSGEASEIYGSHDIFINATPGSMDKTILEAAASGLVVLAATKGIARGLLEELHWLNFDDAKSLKEAVERSISLTVAQRESIRQELRAWVTRQHSMVSHMLKLGALLHEPRPRKPFRQDVKVWLHKFGLKSHGSGLPVVMFHSFDGRGSAGWDKERLTAWLVRESSSGHAFTDFVGASDKIKGKNLANDILTTVDDATEDLLGALGCFNIAAAKPLVFVPTRTKEIKSSDGCVRRVLPLEKLTALAKAGLLELGAHSRTHANLTELEPRTLAEEIKGAKADIQAQQGTEVPVFAYPRGKFSPAVITALKDAGFTAAFTVSPGTWSSETDLYAIPRIPVMWWMSSKDLAALIK